MFYTTVPKHVRKQYYRLMISFFLSVTRRRKIKSDGVREIGVDWIILLVDHRLLFWQIKRLRYNYDCIYVNFGRVQYNVVQSDSCYPYILPPQFGPQWRMWLILFRNSRIIIIIIIIITPVDMSTVDYTVLNYVRLIPTQ